MCSNVVTLISITVDCLLIQTYLQITTSNINRLETSRSSHMMQINRLESQVRGLELTVSTLGAFISTLAYNNSDLEIPGEILRIIAQLNVSERKTLPNNIMGRSGVTNRSAPLRVIDDSKSNPQPEKKIPPPFKSIASSPNLPTPKSSFFSSSYSHINQQKLGLLPGEKASTSSLNNGLKQSLSDSSSLKLLMNDEKNKDFFKSMPAKTDQPLLGRILTDEDRKALGLMKKESDFLTKSNSMPSKDGKKLLKTSQSSFELGKSESESSMADILPLNSDTVNICFGGTTKLKTIRPLKTRNESCSSILSQSSSSGSLFEGSQLPSNKRIELQIVEPTDSECTGSSSFEENSEFVLFNTKRSHREGSFDKTKGIEAEQMIKSQVPAKQPSLLT